ncbi:putative calcium-dependent channel, 7TM region, putative phosphate [Lyophyllum shimeji]|uniref:Calcium-dependent channel, 7TM region, putative phosphate n=1 Tax=Lyophyllum shimeji TaxID=47721 RepID=A0A9P3PGZ4_LYOSH|nr:putative calcium-dependent channel, 7TM region, putative phosphate [Lyophyllum shimeji]
MSGARVNSPVLIRPRRPHDGWSTTPTPSPSPNIPPNTGSEPTPTPTPPDTNTPPPNQSQPIPFSSGSSSFSNAAQTVFTTAIPVTTVTQPSTTFTSFSETIITIISSSDSNTSPGPVSSPAPSTSSPTSSASRAFSSGSPTNQPVIGTQQICIGNGLDSSAEGLLASLIVPTAIGLVLWLLFAIVRPRFRQIYALREWFVQQDLRPKPLGSGFFAFLFPHVPLVPPLPSDVSNAGRSAAEDAELFPSDEQLNQRALWISFLIVLGWTVLGLAGALPLYLVSTPCLADSGAAAIFGGAYSTLQDLSLMRLLRLFDNRSVPVSNLVKIQPRAVNDPQNARVRVIVLTILTLVLGLLPALWKIIKEFNKLLEYRRNFTEVRCEGKELGWLSATRAPGFVGWGEKRLKDFMVKTGLSYSMEPRDGRNRGQARNSERRHRGAEDRQPLNRSEEANLEIDIQSFFSIGDTQALALLIDERDEILENLEIAETRYIGSFRVTTPDPSIADYEPPSLVDPSRPYISRPLPLGQNSTRRTQRGRRRRANPAFAASSLAPTSFVAPSQYYKLRSVRGVSGGRFADSGIDQLPTLSESINSRVIGSRFLEVNRNSTAYGRLPLGSHVVVEKSGQIGPGSSPAQDEPFRFSTIPDPRRFGPNYAADDSVLEEVDEDGMRHDDDPEQGENYVLNDSWVDISKEPPRDTDSEPNGPLPGPSTFRRRPKKEPVSSVRRETFPLRNDPESMQPPHLRLQPAQPFVRPLDGLNFDDLGHVYADITQWRSRLKAINAEIAEVQRESYNDIADGTRIKGWLMVGRGLRFIPGVQLIEGRAKEDVRWDVLQNERSASDTAVFWAIVVVVIVLLAAGLTAASGLALATAPDVAHYLTFLGPLLTTDRLPAGIATVVAPAVAATLFVSLALYLVHWVANVHGSISISGGQLFVFRITFFILTAVAALWLVAVGALLYSLRVFSSNSGTSKSVASGSIYMSILALAIILNLAIIFPAVLLLQPLRLWRVLRDERQAITPRQRFRAVYPRTYNPSFATGACILAIVFASTFSLIFPLIGPAVTVLLFLTLIAHRYLIGYVYGRTHSQTGGLLQIWLVKRLGTLLSFQPILLGLIFLSRTFWIEGGVLVGSGVLVIVFVEAYTAWKMRLPGRNSLSPITQDSLNTFEITAWNPSRRGVDDEGTSHGSSSGRNTRTRGSMASVLEMMSLTLAVMPSNTNYRGPVPLQTETLDDLTATERAARTHPDAPPHLPPLPFTDHAEEMAGILYAPELIAPPPIIWLPNDSAGVARSEAVDLQKYHDLAVTLDVRAKEDVLPRRSSSSRRRTSS